MDCAGCVWGKFTGTTYSCLFPRCLKHLGGNWTRKIELKEEEPIPKEKVEEAIRSSALAKNQKQLLLSQAQYNSEGARKALNVLMGREVI